MNSFRAVFAAAALAAAVPLSAFAQGGVKVEDPFARASAGTSGAGAAYMTIRNSGAADRLVSASSAVAGRVELHDHIREGDVMKMRKIEAITVPANGAAELKPGGLHVMLMNLKQPLKPGETIEITLNFEKAGAVAVKVPVKEIGAGMGQGMGPGMGQGMGSGMGGGHRKGH